MRRSRFQFTKHRLGLDLNPRGAAAGRSACGAGQFRNALLTTVSAPASVLDGLCSVTVSWSRNGERVASIGIYGGRDRIHLHYRQQSPGETEWRQVAQDILIDWQSNRYGGTSPYFVCPHCSRSVWHIYMSGGANACRHCLRLTYESRRSRSYDRLAETVHRLRMKLGGDPGFDSIIAPRPKGMHRRTYERMCERIFTLERASWDRCASWLGRIESRIGRGRKLRQGSFWA